ncbi:Aldo/keto reductase [Petrocella atlantisensis]|uniref:Aldo/keto reductase n=1 Tax=Petrocella atlantisensis TaxID=2173034 RepID=A0A3P7PDM9_9FIRM|nr:aldo/keto reductase [Petrocella atlantisensis]VDN47008.1 Aldo/keto reductase [Petrocella atlantisensis]
MKKLHVSGDKISIPQIGLGCMRIVELTKKDANHLINTSMELGINFFDHADIYGGGKSETLFSEAVSMSALSREKMILQSKCGIRKGFFDFSKDHILQSVDGILKRLNTDYLDILLLHRPDTLFEPEEVAEAFDYLYDSGKVRHFGVSNQNPMQMALLESALHQPLLFNQLQFGIMHTGMVDAGLNVNMKVTSSIDHDGGILEYCRLHNITIQAWSPFQYGFFDGVFLNKEKFPELNAVIDRLAERYKVSDSAIAVAWISRHPAKIQTIVGTTNHKRLRQISEADTITLTREEWYEIYRAAGNILP